MKDNTKEEMRNLLYVSIISADNDEFDLTEEDKQEIIDRRRMGCTWEYILEPIKDKKRRRALIDIFTDEEN